MHKIVFTQPSTDFQQLTRLLRRRLRPDPVVILADFLRVHLRLSEAKTDELREEPDRDQDVVRKRGDHFIATES